MDGFIQTGDLHIGECRSLDKYLDRHRLVLSQIIDIAEYKQLPLIIVGDLFHFKNFTILEWFLANWFFGELEKKKIETIIIAGNHDHLWGDVTYLDGYKSLPFKNIKIVSWYPSTCSIGNIGFICLSWHGYSKEELEEVVKSKISEISQSKYKVVLMHECTIGSKYNNESVALKGISIPQIPQIDYWALGDIHTYQAIRDNAWYAGSPAQFKFEDSLPKGLLLVNLAKLPPEFIPIASKPLKVVQSMEDIVEDAYYMVKGNLETVLKANQNENVVKTDWIESEKSSITYQRLGILDGLPEFLASKGIEEEKQKEAITWVQKILDGKEYEPFDKKVQ